jgi:hypothetical protein
MHGDLDPGPTRYLPDDFGVRGLVARPRNQIRVLHLLQKTGEGGVGPA